MITAVTGLNGAGKTAYSVGLLRRWAAKGVDTYANIGVRGARLVENFDQLMALRNCVLLVDEITAVASSRQFASLTPEALLFFQTLRHSNIGLIWTAPTFDRCDLALRSLTLHWVHLMPLITTLPKGGIWRNTRVSFVLFGKPVEGVDGAKMDAAFPGLYLPSRHWQDYDTLANVDLFSRTNRFPNRCPNCGVGIDYGRLKAAESRDSASFSAITFFCARCTYDLGTAQPVTRNATQNPADHGSALVSPLNPRETDGSGKGVLPTFGSSSTSLDSESGHLGNGHAEPLN